MPQALALTAIVISFGVGALLLALAYRSWQLTGDDLVEDDVEDRRIAAEAARLVDEEVADQEALGASLARVDAGRAEPGELT
jgi:multicomponent Na+:H+ antiporter subunit C